MNFKKINNIKSYKTILFFVFGMFAIINTVKAEESMTGGGYTLNGGVSVFTGSPAGGDYTLGVNGGSLTPETSTGGSYSMSPSPYFNPVVTTSNGSSNTGFANSYVFGNEYPIKSNLTKIATSASENIFKKNVNPIPGVEWIDQGKGVDSNLDGVIDASRSERSENGYIKKQKPKRGQKPDSIYPVIKIHKTPLTTSQKGTFLSILMLLCFVRIFKKRPATENFSGQDTYLVSKYPIAIVIDMIIALHKNDPTWEHIMENNIRDIEAPNEQIKPAQNIHFLNKALIFIACLGFIIWVWPSHMVVSLVLVFGLIFRQYVAFRLK